MIFIKSFNILSRNLVNLLYYKTCLLVSVYDYLNEKYVTYYTFYIYMIYLFNKTLCSYRLEHLV